MALRVLHLVGSAVNDALDDLSRLYARECLAAVADPLRYDPVIAHVSPGGSWRFPTGLEDRELDAAAPLALPAAVGRLAELGIDVMVPHMFCVPGMTVYRALFDLLEIPFIGNPSEVMAIGARKDLARAIVAEAGVAIPAGQVIREAGELNLELPLVIKPTDADNSSGISLVRRADALAAAIDAATVAGSAVLAEQFIAPGREVRCGVLERGNELVCLPLEEYPLDAGQRPIRTSEDKLGRDAAGELKLMAKGGARAWVVDSADPVNEAVRQAARASHRALGCRDYSLFDFRIDPEGRPWFLEAGLYCSFAPDSVVATMARAAGISLGELFQTMVDRALARGHRSVGSPA